MVPPKDVAKATKSKSSPIRKRPAAVLESNGSGKKMGSLSSFQATLNFSSLPQAPIKSTSAPARSTARKVIDLDAQLMPPPSKGYKTMMKTSEPSSSGGHSNGRAQDRGKSREVVEILDEEDGTLPRQSSAGQMWTDIYAPTAEADLATGKKRVEKVRNWLSEALYGHPADYLPSNGGQSQVSRDKIRKYKRILLLTGPAGTGKTTTVRLLAREMGVDLVEWEEGQEEWSIGNGFERESSISKISTFLSRQSYAPLNLYNQGSSSQGSSTRPRVLLLTTLPNLSHSPTRDAFHSTLLRFCQDFSSVSCPLVIVHSEAGSGGKAEESWMDRDRGGREGALELVGKSVKDGPWCQEVDFIPLAPTFVARAMNRLLVQAVPEASQRPSAAAVQLIALSSNGDLRSAINSLQLLCSQRRVEAKAKKQKKGEEDGSSESSKRRLSGKGSRGGKGAKLDVSSDLRAVLDAVTRREQSLNLFHALGKVFYNKRLGDPTEDTEDQEEVSKIRDLPSDHPLPPHLQEYNRRKGLVQLENYLPTIPVDASSFLLWVHQSFPSFCTVIEQVSLASEDFCRSDIMRTDEDIWQSSPQAIAYALHLTVRGALLALPSPVPRSHQKILKPQFFSNFKQERENATLLDTAAGYIVRKAVASSVALSKKSLDASGEAGAVCWGGSHSTTTLATELIPMMVKIQSKSNLPLLPVAVRSLSLPPFTLNGYHVDELSASAEVEENDLEEAAGGEDGLGVVYGAGQGWDEGDEGKDDKEEQAWLEEDDIADWD